MGYIMFILMDNHSESVSLPYIQPFVGESTKQGGKSLNEDYKVSWKLQVNQPNARHVIASGVFDGHGGFGGKIASKHCGDMLIAFLEANKEVCPLWSNDEWKSQLQQFFPTMHNSFRDELIKPNQYSYEQKFADSNGVVRTVCGDHPVHGGTTATIIVVLIDLNGKRTVISANVGDSTALLISPTLPNGYKFLTLDHSPDDESEWKRINDLDETQYPTKLLCVYDKTKIYKKFLCPLIFDANGVKNPFYVENPWGNGLHPTNVRYEAVVYAVTPSIVQRDVTCIAMLRAIGDFYAHPFGLTCEATITINELDDGDFFIANASDGVWDNWKWEEFAAALTSTYEEKASGKTVDDKLLEDIAESMVACSYDIAVKNFGASHVDDTSLVITKLPQ